MKNLPLKVSVLVISGFVLTVPSQAQTQNPHLFQPVYSITLSQETSVFNRNYVEKNHSQGHQDYNAIDRRLSDQSRKVKKRKRIDISNPGKRFFLKRP